MPSSCLVLYTNADTKSSSSTLTPSKQNDMWPLCFHDFWELYVYCHMSSLTNRFAVVALQTSLACPLLRFKAESIATTCPACWVLGATTAMPRISCFTAGEMRRHRLEPALSCGKAGQELYNKSQQLCNAIFGPSNPPHKPPLFSSDIQPLSATIRHYRGDRMTKLSSHKNTHKFIGPALRR